ncbi:MAG: NAD-dependent DNA ligase LigA [Caldisericia bacterium]|nr:NAD-dependent DNA ligase LigA [Caldisericia bacterium]
MSLKDLISSLKKQIQAHNYRYYVLDDPNVSDQEYDAMFKQLKKLEESNPELITVDSPTQRVGHEPLNSFQRFIHKSKMYSLDNAFNKEDIDNWVQRASRINDITHSPIVAEPKLDGLSIEIAYDNGILTSAGTRGNGLVGENVTLNVRTIKSIPLSIISTAKFNNVKLPSSFRVRGEIIMKNSDFVTLNESRRISGDTEFANPRNAAAGALRQLNPTVTSQRNLTAYFYFLTDYDSNEFHFSSHHEILDFLKKLGFPVNPEIKQLKSFNEIENYQLSLQKKRFNLPYEIDGSVFKIDNIELWEKLGFTSRAPKWAIAYKFQAERVYTTIHAIRISVGRTGILTPVAELKPILVGGVTVSNATLHNYSELKKKDIRVLDTVIIQRAGDVIPEVIEVDISKRPNNSVPLLVPTHCPVCNSEVYNNPEEIYIKCINVNCPARIEESFFHFVSKSGMDIDGLGKQLMSRLIKEDIVFSIPDIYLLQPKDLMKMEGIQRILANKLILSIQESKQKPFWRFLSAIGIEGVGETTAKLLVKYFNGPKDFLLASKEMLIAIPGIGPGTAENIINYIHNSTNVDMVNKCVELCFTFSNDSPKSSSNNLPLLGISFVISGTLSVSRDTIKETIESLGGSVKSAISSKINFLISGENPGSKFDKAKTLGVKILSEDDFRNLYS